MSPLSPIYYFVREDESYNLYDSLEMKTRVKIDRKLAIHQAQAQGLNVAKKFRSVYFLCYYTPFVENLFFFNFSMDVDFVIGSSEMHFRWQIIFNVIAEFGHRDLVVEKWKGEAVSYCWFKESFKYVFPVNKFQFLHV